MTKRRAPEIDPYPTNVPMDRDYDPNGPPAIRPIGSQVYVQATVDIVHLFTAEAMTMGIPVTEALLNEYKYWAFLQTKRLWEKRARQFLKEYAKAHGIGTKFPSGVDKKQSPEDSL